MTGIDLLPYWLLFMVWATAAVQADRRQAPQFQKIFFIVGSVATALMIGLRLEVGGDWTAYIRMYDDIYFLMLRDAISVTDAGYAFLNWLAIQFGFNVAFVNLICAALFMIGIAKLAWHQPNPALAMLVATPYLIIVVAMGYTRQAAAIGIICFAITTSAQRPIRLIVLIGIAALFHKSAILILPIALRPIIQRNLLLGTFGIGAFVVLFVVLLQGSSDQLVTNYVKGNYDSQGALIRVLMNVAPAVLFLALRKRMNFPKFEYEFWLSCAVLAIASVIGLATASASSGIDRISLYLIPLQMVVYANLPYVLDRSRRSQASVLLAVIAYCFAVQYTWLFYADNVSAWLPYKTTLS
jgi:hypothetical protein